MSRLNDVSCNNEQWSITKKTLHHPGYNFVNKLTLKFYDVRGDIIGVEQISEDTFLVHKKTNEGSELSRLQITDEEYFETVIRRFHSFDFLTDDTILFDNNFVYSISKNSEVMDFDWLQKYTINVCDTGSGKKVLFVSANIVSTELPHLYDMVAVDAETFKPITPAYSSLRYANIPLSEEFTFPMLVEEDNKYAKIIGDFLFKESIQLNNNARNALYAQAGIVKKNNQ